MSDIKSFFKSRFVGGNLIEADYSQLEVVGLAFLSRDRQLRTDIIDKVDIHSVNAANLIGMAVPKFLDLKKLKDPYALNQRNLAKRLSFQLQYGAGANSMAKQNKIGVDVAKRFIDNYYERYPGVRKWQEDVAQQVADARVVHPSLHTEAGYPVGESVFSSVTGRRYYFREYDNPYYGKDKKWGKISPPTNFSPTQLKNYPVQGFATGDIVPMMLGKMYRRIAGNPNLLLINTVHDSMVFDSNHREMDTIDACRLIRQELSLTPQYIREEFGLPFDLPLEVEIKAGKMWADMDVIPLD